MAAVAASGARAEPLEGLEQPARDGSGWVGHSGLHSVRGISVAVAALAAIVIVQHALHWPAL